MARRGISSTVVTLTIIFSLPFVFIGIYGIFIGLHGTNDSLLLLILGSLFALTGAGVIVGVLVQRRRLAQLAALREEHPSDPWMVNPDWRTNRIVSRSRSGATGRLVIASLIMLVIGGVLAVAIPLELEKGHRAILWTLFMPAIVFLFLKSAAGEFIRAVRWGESVLVLDKLPVPIGGELRGRIETRVPRERLARASNIGAILMAEETHWSGRSGSRSVSTRPIATDFAIIEASAVLAGPEGGTIPVEFRIPVTATPTNDVDPDNQVAWRLSVTAEIPGIDYSVEFEVPVFAT